jgi:hypothetical protein
LKKTSIILQKKDLSKLEKKLAKSVIDIVKKKTEI